MENDCQNLTHLSVEMILVSTKMACHLKNKQKYLMNLLMKDFLKLIDLRKKIKSNNLIYKFENYLKF